MKKLLFFFAFTAFTWFFLPLNGFSDTVFLKEGTRWDVGKTWEEDGQIKFELYGSIVGFPKQNVLKVEKDSKAKKSNISSSDKTDSDQVDNVLLNGTISAAKSLVFPGNDVNVNYDENKRLIHVKFVLPISKNINYANMWLPWRDNQWVVLQEFKKADIMVNYVAVETNYLDGSGLVRITHQSKHVDKYAKLPNNDLWLRTGEFYQKGKNETKWSKIDY